MKIIISKAELRRIATPVAKAAASGKSARPIYEHVLFAAADDRLNLYAGDGLTFLSAASKAEVKEEGQIAVKAADLLKRLDTMPDGPLVMAAERVNGVVSAYSLRSQTSARKHQYPCIDGADFPEQPGLDDGVKVTLGAAKLRTLLERVKHATTLNEGRFTDFIWVSSTGSTIFAAAADSRRFAYADAECAEPIEPFNALLSAPSAERIISVLADTGDTEVTITDRYFCVSFDCFDVQCVMGTQGMPRNALRDIAQIGVEVDYLEVNTAVLLEAIKAVRLSAEEQHNSVHIGVRSGILTITSTSPDRGSSEDEIGGIEYRDCDPIGANVDYVKDMLDNARCERIRLAIQDDHLRAKGTGYEALVMRVVE